MSEYRVAIIGTGRMGGLIEDELAPNQFSSPYGHFSAYQAMAETEVIAVANRSPERLERFSALRCTVAVQVNTGTASAHLEHLEHHAALVALRRRHSRW